MLPVSSSFTQQALADYSNPVQSLFIAWDKQTSIAGYFTVGVSLIGGPSSIKGNGNNAAEADTYIYYDESNPVISIEYDRLMSEPVYSTSKAVADIILDNTNDRYTPNFDPTIGAYITTQRPLRISEGFVIGGVSSMIQTFVGQIDDIPQTDQSQKTVTLHCIDFAQVLWDYAVTQTQLYQNKRTDELIVILLSQFGLPASKYVVDKGTVTIPYAYFAVDDKMGQIIEDLTEAEQGSFYVDELGTFHFEGRAKWNDAPHTNQKHLQVKATAYTAGAGCYWQSAAIPVSVSTTYYLSERYLCNAAGSKITVQLTDNVGALTYIDVVTGLATSADMTYASWVAASGSFTTAAHTVSVQIFHQLLSVGTLEVDDSVLALYVNTQNNNLVANFSSEMSTTGANLIANGDFETNLASWTAYQHGSDPYPSFAQDLAQHYTGTASAKIGVTTSTSDQGIFQNVTVTSGLQYNLSAWLMGAVGGEVVTLMCGSNTATITLTTGWQQVTVPFVATSTTLTCQVSTTAHPVSFWVDGFRLTVGQGGTVPSWNYGSYGTITAFGTLIDRLSPDAVVDLSDSHVYTEKQLQQVSGQASVVNLVEIFASPRAPMASDQLLYAIGTNDSRQILPGATLEFFVNYNDPLISNHTPITSGGSSIYAANSLPDGTGAVRTSDVTIGTFTNFAQATKVDIQNTSATTLYLTTFQIWGKTAPVTQTIYVKQSDATSIQKYQEQPVSITNNYIQTFDIANSIASKLVADRKDPASYLTIECKGLPHVQLGDNVTRNGTNYWITRIKSKFNGNDGLASEFTLIKRTINP